MISALRTRVATSERQGGFTLIELLVVIIIIGILLAIAIPSYLSFRDRATKAAAQSNLRAAIPSIEAYYADNGSYASMTASGLRASYDAGLAASVTVLSAGSTTYCVQSTEGSFSYYKSGPASSIGTTACT